MTRWSVLILCVAGCASPDPDARVDLRTPDRASFAPVSAMLQQRCGSLDCHGTEPRNLRLYGFGGLRLDEAHRPDAPATTTEAELDASFRSICALEPERTTEAVLAREPERMTFFRKALGTEAHKGGARLDANGERCLRAWLTGSRDDAACSAAAQR